MLTQKLERVFTLDLTLAEQLFGARNAANKQRGEYELLCALLEDAIRCFQKQSNARGWRAQRFAREAEEWFFSDDYQWPFSFLNVCAILGIDATYIRDGLRRWRQQHPDGLPLQKRRSASARTLLRKAA